MTYDWSLRRFHVHLRIISILLFWDRKFYKYRFFFCSDVLFKTVISLLTLGLHDLFITISEVFRSPSIVAFLSVSPFRSIIKCFIYFGASGIGAYILMCYVFLMNFLLYYYLFLILKSILSDIIMTILAFLLIAFAWSIIFYPSFEPIICLCSWDGSPERNMMVRPCFLIYPATLCILIGEFSPFKFRVIINIWVYYIFCFWLAHLQFLFPCVSVSYLVWCFSVEIFHVSYFFLNFMSQL